jgi:aspartyl protease family protein
MLSTIPPWAQLAVLALCAAAVLTALFKLPYVGRALRGLFSFGMLALCLFVLFQQAPYHPRLAPLLDSLGLDEQEVAGGEVRIRMAPDGHFWARATINGVPTRMLVDSGATLTALSTPTAERAGVKAELGVAPIFTRTANGVVQARPASVDDLQIGEATASDLKVVVSPALGTVDVLGMNFLTRLASWRVEGQTLILTPRS